MDFHLVLLLRAFFLKCQSSIFALLSLSSGFTIPSAIDLFNLNPKSPPVALPITVPFSYIGLFPNTSASVVL